MPTAYVALGSNLKEPILQVNKALKALATLPDTSVVKASSLYQTAPVGYDHQPDFINAVAELNTWLTPDSLLEALLDIETVFGRERPFPNAPRVLDLDLLLYDAIDMQTEKLILPHPRMHLRGFVMLPLAEISPELTLPNGMRTTDLARQFEAQGIQKL
jgi:2-amino-4-hydroxy-6-hydroxymethyldihydropteridine diphosphokinase